MNRLAIKFIKGCAATVMAIGLPIATFGLQTKPAPMPGSTPPVAAPTTPMPGGVMRPPAMNGRLMRMGGGNYERSIPVAANVKLTIPCVSEGRLRVNGWNRSEIRIFIKNGTGLNFNIRETAPKDGLPVWLDAVAFDPKKPLKTQCLWGESIEVDAPAKTVIEVAGQEYRADLDSIRRATVRTVGGSITARNISGGLTANTGIGNIIVEDSGGAMDLQTTAGNIIAFDISPSETGDPFTAKSQNGNISLQSVEHGQVNISSISGSVNFTGPVRKAGTYDIRTEAGTIRMTLPQETECKLGVVYGFGTLTMEFPARLLTEEVNSGPIKKRVFQLGNGGTAVVKLQTTNGSISVKKQLPAGISRPMSFSGPGFPTAP